MGQKEKRIFVQLDTPERKFVKVYHDFLRNQLLTTEEKMVFIVLKSFVGFSEKDCIDGDEVYPTVDTICRLSSLSKPRAIRTIKKLVEKKVVKKIRRGLTKSNLYILSDHARIWLCDNAEDMGKAVENKPERELTLEEHVSMLKEMGYEVEIKKRPVSGSRKTTDTDTHENGLNNHNTSKDRSQEYYTMQALKEIIGYEDAITCHPDKRKDIDTVFSILHNAVNTRKKTIRVDGEDKDRNVVIGKLMKLRPDDLMFAINKYHEQTGRIKNVEAYLLTLLYHAKNQSYLDLMNLGHYNGDF